VPSIASKCRASKAQEQEAAEKRARERKVEARGGGDRGEGSKSGRARGGGEPEAPPVDNAPLRPRSCMYALASDKVTNPLY